MDRLKPLKAPSRLFIQMEQVKLLKPGLLFIKAMLSVQAMAQALEARRQGRLLRIEAALQRLDAGDYGLCEECGENIPPKRLEIDPATERCVVCAL